MGVLRRRGTGTNGFRFPDSRCTARDHARVSIELRDATPDDVEAIAALHADSWRRTYRGALADEYLDGDVVEERRGVWRARLASPAPLGGTIVAFDGDVLAGFAHTEVDHDPTWGSMLDNLHVAHTHRRRGIATRLMAATAEWVATHAAEPRFHLWVLKQNTAAQAFYEALDGRCVEESLWHAPGGGPPAPELRYAWENLDRLRSLG